MFRVVVVDDQPGFRKMAIAMLEKDPIFEVVGEAEDGAIAVEIVEKLSPDVVLMDIQMPNMNGFEAARIIQCRDAPPKVILTSMNEDREYLRLASEVGAAAFVPKRELTAQRVLGALT